MSNVKGACAVRLFKDEDRKWYVRSSCAAHCCLSMRHPSRHSVEEDTVFGFTITLDRCRQPSERGTHPILQVEGSFVPYRALTASS